jgi:hypothetical protein
MTPVGAVIDYFTGVTWLKTSWDTIRREEDTVKIEGDR